MTRTRTTHLTPVGLLLRLLLAVLLVAAVMGLGIVFVGADATVARVLLSVLVLGAACLFGLAAVPAPHAALRWGLITLIAVEAVLVWAVIWSPEPPDALGRATAMLGLLVVLLAVATVLARVTAGARLRVPRIIARVSDAAGLILLGMGWAMILTDGEALPGRVLAGVVIIYATSALAAVVLALMRSYTVVRRTE